MRIRITEKMLCIPPHLSTTWDNIRSLRIEHDSATAEPSLVIALSDGYRVRIYDLSEETIDNIFSMHLKALETKTDGRYEAGKSPLHALNATTDPIFQLLQLGGLDFAGKQRQEHLIFPMQHMPEHTRLPNLPPEILKKVAQVARLLHPEELKALPKFEPHCNCLHCQILRTIRHEHASKHVYLDEEVHATDLQFRTWDVEQKSEHFYSVSNPLDVKECYDVFLGSPIGCSCGSKHCEHIKAVLNT